MIDFSGIDINNFMKVYFELVILVSKKIYDWKPSLGFNPCSKTEQFFAVKIV